jgi:uncharacterized protein (TIGR02444 family)
MGSIVAQSGDVDQCGKRLEGPVQLDNPFWRFSLAVHGAPGVDDECLTLQDAHGIDVDVLLFCVWVGSRGTLLTAENMAAIETLVQPWRDTAIRPLRAARRGIKTLPQMADADVAALRKDVAALELRAEQIEHAMLYAMAATLGPTTTVAPLDAMRCNVSALGRGRSVPGLDAPRLIEAALKLSFGVA